LQAVKTEKVDVLVIGAGPAGAASAAMLCHEGLNVKVVEKATFPRFVIGESLLPHCMDHFEEMGVLEALKKQGYQKKIGATFRRGDKICRFEFASQYSKSWDWTWQVPRDEFDKVVADAVAAQGVDFEYGSAVEAVSFEGRRSKTTVKTAEGEEKVIEADFLVDASGYGRVLPNLLGLTKESSLKSRSSIFTHAIEKDPDQREDMQRITVISHSQDIWIWIIPFSNGKTSIGFSGDSEFIQSFEGDNEEKMRQLLAENDYTRERFADCTFSAPVRCLTAYAIGVTKLFDEGFVLTGNTGEFLDPVFSSGVTLALESGSLAGKLAARQLKGEEIDWQQDYADHMAAGTEAFKVYVEAWYEGTLQNIFYGKIQEGSIKEQITSILAGHVWDENNPMIHRSRDLLSVLSKLVAS
jgi:flavin-dependent dehydrogenase